MANTTQSPRTNFTVFVRLPFPRGDFVDPPPVEWNADKDQALWHILSHPSKEEDVDWRELANRFNVTLQFLLQQAAWLYDRQLSQVRAQMRRVGSAHPSPSLPASGFVSGSTALGCQPMKKALSSGPRAHSHVAAQQQTMPSGREPLVRSASTATVTQSRNLAEVPRTTTPTAEIRERKKEEFTLRPSVQRREESTPLAVRGSPTSEKEDFSSTSSDDSTYDEAILGRVGPRFKRFGKFSMHKVGPLQDEDAADESPAFLPLERDDLSSSHEPSGQDLNATLRLGAEQSSRQRRRSPEQAKMLRKSLTTESSASSASSGVPVGFPRRENGGQLGEKPGVSSPRKVAELAGVSPRKSVTSGKDTGDTPSMGSSFSDLDDASVTQSALEEALLSNMQQKGIGSQMSSISQALRSRYF